MISVDGGDLLHGQLIIILAKALKAMLKTLPDGGKTMDQGIISRTAGHHQRTASRKPKELQQPPALSKNGYKQRARRCGRRCPSHVRTKRQISRDTGKERQGKESEKQRQRARDGEREEQRQTSKQASKQEGKQVTGKHIDK